MAEIPHSAYPFQRDPHTGKLAVVEQDSEAHVLACVQVIIHCPTGFRVDRPEFGWPFPDLAQSPVDSGPLLSAITTFEPRATATAQEYLDTAVAGTDHIDVEVSTASKEA